MPTAHTPRLEIHYETAGDAAELRWYQGGHMFLVQDRSAWSDIIGFLEWAPAAIFA